VKRLAFAAVLLLSIACRGARVPRDTQMWRIEGEWQDEGNSIRTARAAIISFRSSKEYVEVHTSVIERPNGAVYIMARGGRTSAVGQWKQGWSKVEVEKKKVVGVPCGRVTYTVQGNTVSDGSGTYSPVTNLIAVEFETFVNATKQQGTSCGEP
jgi:hypothetical protein